MTPQQTNPTPKDRFQQSPDNIKKHHVLLEDPAFQRAEDFALMHYQRILAAKIGSSQLQPNPNFNPQVEGMINGWKITGVMEFLSELRNLAEKPIEVKPPGLGRTLDHAN